MDKPLRAFSSLTAFTVLRNMFSRFEDRRHRQEKNFAVAYFQFHFGSYRFSFPGFPRNIDQLKKDRRVDDAYPTHSETSFFNSSSHVSAACFLSSGVFVSLR